MELMINIKGRNDFLNKLFPNKDLVTIEEILEKLELYYNESEVEIL